MNLNSLELFDEVWLMGLMVVVAIAVVVVSWMSTKVDCDFRHVRTIILQANSQRIENYERANRSPSPVATAMIRLEEINRLNVELVDRDSPSRRDEIGNEETELTSERDSFDLSLPSSGNKASILKNKTFFRAHKSMIRIRIKYLDDREKLVLGNCNQTISLFKRDNFLEEQSQDLNVRLIYNGQELKEEDRTLEQYGLTNNCTVHCLITQPRHQIPIQSTPQSSMSGVNSDQSDIEIGHLMFPLFGALLTVIWYCRICYRHYFNVITTFALIGMTVVYFIACITCFSFGNTFYSVNNHQTPLHRNRSIQSTGISSTESTRLSLTSTFSSF